MYFRIRGLNWLVRVCCVAKFCFVSLFCIFRGLRFWSSSACRTRHHCLGKIGKTFSRKFKFESILLIVAFGNVWNFISCNELRLFVHLFPKNLEKVQKWQKMHNIASLKLWFSIRFWWNEKLCYLIKILWNFCSWNSLWNSISVEIRCAIFALNSLNKNHY